ncbi:MAG: YifB family Mg chelatase-like AAA ATPase [Planctomycetota bacterium]|nr:YifB family Mg chelatase-like AAA ATPase [Planctomycetota bacterium]
MAFRLLSGDLFGIEGREVEVEVDLIPALSSFVISGLPGKGIRESRERIRSALENSGFRYPDRHRIVINLAPASWHKDGAAFDLPIAISILAASGQIAPESLRGWAVLGELALDGRVRSIAGCLGIITRLRRSAVRSVLVPASNHSLALAVEGLHVVGASTLQEALAVIRGERIDPPATVPGAPSDRPEEPFPDLSEVRGHHHARRVLEISATGEHSLLMVGPPGSGKSFLARRLPGILPPMNQNQQVEVTQIHDVCGEFAHQQLVISRPFRAPHHSVSWAGLIGGGSPPMPGEVTRAHHGVLFLDEFPELARRSLEALREPLEEGSVTISRSGWSRKFPSRFLLVAAMNPCPCGYASASSPTRCRCSPTTLANYRARISGPIIDRVDLHLQIEPISAQQLLDPPDRSLESSAVVRRRIEQARQRATDRGQQGPNRDLEWSDHDGWAPLSREARQLLLDGQQQGEVSTRGLTRWLRLARTIADMRSGEQIEAVDLLEAMTLRTPSSSLV